MDHSSTGVRYNLLGLLVGVACFLAVVIFGSISLAAQDVLWFVPGFSERPVRIIVYNAGLRTELQPGQRGFTELSAAIVESLNRGVARQSGIGLSQGSLADAYNRYETVEAFFSHRVKLHAPFDTGDPTQMLFPITGLHSEQPMVFLGGNGIYISNAPILNTVQPIRSSLTALGF